MPKNMGLYQKQFEHESCGIGFIVNIKGKKSNKIIIDALNILRNLEHRGACCDDKTGDGAGILLQIPDKFFRQKTEELNIKLPPRGEYGIGMCFFQKNESKCREQQRIFESEIKNEGCLFLGWRKVPTNNKSLGDTPINSEPSVYQAFIKKSPGIKDDLDFERRLYLVRKKIEKKISSDEGFYILTLSCRTIVYKGMFIAHQLEEYYPDLLDTGLESSLVLIHSRFSTNTFPSWERAHPYRYIIHNGEINTLRGNINWMHAREAMLESDYFSKEELNEIFPVINPEGSDSAIIDNVIEFLYLNGRSLPHVLMMLIPEPWENHETMSENKKAFYEFHSHLMEPWDGPASIAFTDGIQIGAVLDRNGLRPSRYYVTEDEVVLSSEVGVLDIKPGAVKYKGRLEPGKMLLIDTHEGRIINDEEIKNKIISEQPYKEWIKNGITEIDDLPDPFQKKEVDTLPLINKQIAFGYTYEDMEMILQPMAVNKVEPIGSMGNDTPLAVLSNKPQLLYNYFKQLFAQVSNPPLDSIKEKIVTSELTSIGSEGNLLFPCEDNANRVKLVSPILSDSEFNKIKNIGLKGFKVRSISILFELKKGAGELEKRLDSIFKEAGRAIDDDTNIIILSDRGLNKEMSAIPALLAVAGLHHYLIRTGKRTKVGIIIESGEPREVHHFALLIGYGATAINPYMAYESIKELVETKKIEKYDYYQALDNYIGAAVKGIIKTISKMGISIIQSYRGAQIFEAVGLKKEIIDKYFSWTVSRIEGIGMKELYEEIRMRHQKAFPERHTDALQLDESGFFRWRKNGEYHLFNPETIYKLQFACRTNKYEIFKEYSEAINNQAENLCTIRSLLKFKLDQKSIPIDEVEPIESIMQRFKTGGMSYGSISRETHESLAIAMNRINGKSNTGEGGEDPKRFEVMPNGDSKSSAIKQVAAGRFGVTIEYLVNSKEIQIKIAQGAKPGEGGQLPGHKVYPWIAKVRYATPGVGLISPPPHHDIYSIEDLAQLIYDLKNANPDARISVKLVASAGVGTIAAGVSKGRADLVLISGYDGGTGASPLSSIKHAGIPWELGLSETHQTLVMNNLRDRIVIETDGQLRTGRDVVIAALLGAEEFGFATAPLVVLGCVMMRVCHLNTCPVGVATQNPELRKCFTGDPSHVVNFFHFIASEVRELMAYLGFKVFNEMVGRADLLERNNDFDNWKSKGIDLSDILYKPEPVNNGTIYCSVKQDHKIDTSLDVTAIMPGCMDALKNGKKIKMEFPIVNRNRTVGTLLANKVTKLYGFNKLDEDTVQINFKGNAGQSFGAFLPKGVTFLLEGDSNDYIGKGLSGGKIIVYPPGESELKAEENIIIGNVAFYGATGGMAFIRGIAGERFCVRNSGVEAVVEGVGDHGCEYMTGGKVIVIGKTGRNFAAGMSGGIAYVYDEDNGFQNKCNCNCEIVELCCIDSNEELIYIKEMLEKHYELTKSTRAKKLLDYWEKSASKFIKILPFDYKHVLEAVERVKKEGLTGEEAQMAAFELNIKDSARVSGN